MLALLDTIGTLSIVEPCSVVVGTGATVEVMNGETTSAAVFGSVDADVLLGTFFDCAC